MSVLNNPLVSGATKRATSELSDFKKFVLRGNVVDLAVGIVIGAAFTTVVMGLVKDLITPLIGISGGFDFSSLRFTVNHSTFLVGDFINAVVTFLLLALVVYFFVVKPVNALVARFEPPQSPTNRDCPYCLSSVPVKAIRCAFCTSALPPVGGSVAAEV